MKYHNFLFLASIFFVLNVADSFSQTETKEDVGPKWNVSDRWKIGVTLYARSWLLSSSDPQVESRKNEPSILGHYLIDVRIIGREAFQEIPCWKLEYLPDNTAPTGIRQQRYHVLVSQRDYSIKNIKRLTGAKGQWIGDIPLACLDDIAMIPGETYGFPFEIFNMKSGSKDQNFRKNEGKEFELIQSEMQIDNIFRTERIFGNLKESKEQQRIVLRTQKNAKWWSEYEKFNQGHKEIYAVTCGDWLSKEFDEVNRQRNSLKAQGYEAQVQRMDNRLKELGIALVPQIMKTIEEGQDDYIPLLAEFTEDLKPDSTKNDCLAWWEKNKNRWLVPFEDKHPEH